MFIGHFPSFAQAEKDYTFVVGNWRGQAHYHEDGRFRSCTMFAPYKSGSEVFFVVDEKLVWALGINNENWTLFPGDDKKISMQIDLDEPVIGDAKVLSRNGFSIQFRDHQDILDNIKRGYQMIIRMEDFKARFELKGTSRAIPQLLDCALIRRNHIASPNRNPRRPQDTVEPKKKANLDAPDAEPKSRKSLQNPLLSNLKGKRVKREKAIDVVTSLFKRKGITLPKFLTPNEHPFPGYDVMWRANTVLWGVLILRDASSVNIDKLVGQIIGKDAALCSQEFASAKKLPQNTSDQIVRHISTICNAETETYEVQYSLIKSNNGTLLNIAKHSTVATGQELSQQMPQNDFLITPDQDIFNSIR